MEVEVGVDLGFGCWFRVSSGPVPGFASSKIPGFVNSGFRPLVPGFARAGSGFRLAQNSRLRLKKLLCSPSDLRSWRPPCARLRWPSGGAAPRLDAARISGRSGGGRGATPPPPSLSGPPRAG